ncbi:AAA family ATPase [Vagococcus fluvialis]|uniref:ATP-dependent nuclease n=1 Tax=Vagococcus fluvialis TaxID=2738 RepID=UPI001432D81D|nr:DUF2813 domain-containing protein [Vagococcus fluvialis]NKC59078.1 AAA family ATPase [Vagococcus fluvialis]NKD49833.1 AAA family ATPase [Vagococcus fluvialis]
MKLSNLIIKNFRNFEQVDIELGNKSVIFGMNDVGKTNLLYSLRYILERKIRSQGFFESDYHERKIENAIEITLQIDLSDRETDEDSQNIISKIGKVRSSNNLDTFYFQVKGDYDDSEMMGIPTLFWGDDYYNLEPIPQKGDFSELDKIFNIIYVDPTIELDSVFSKHKRKLLNQKNFSDEDVVIYNDIKDITTNMNRKIGSMEMIQNFQQVLTNEYHQLKKENISIEFQSEMAISGVFSDITPYIKKSGDDNLYPTSGDGRKKILAYSLLNHVTKEYDSDKIPIFLIEEPENSLHRSMQIALSKQLFDQSIYKYFLLSTHSSELLYEMDRAVLVRIYSKDKIICQSHMYNISPEFSSMKKELNESLTKALFAEKVLLIEGPSEKVLFEKILSEVDSTYELNGRFLLMVDGIKFKPYYETLRALNIIPIVKTDNDIRAKKGNLGTFELLGFNRCRSILNKKNLDDVYIDYSKEDEKGEVTWLVSEKERLVKEEKVNLFTKKKSLVSKFKENNIFLSKIDLEGDLFEAIPKILESEFGTKDPVGKLQDKKMLNMIQLTNTLTKKDCKTIYDHPNFECLQKLVND